MFGDTSECQSVAILSDLDDLASIQFTFVWPKISMIAAKSPLLISKKTFMWYYLFGMIYSNINDPIIV